jgi:uncharacterized protein HemY
VKLEPSADAYLVLGRLDFAANHMGDADKEVGEALKLAPENTAALELRHQIEIKQGQKK